MKKTEQYQLNQWEMSDRIRMEDFNADNARLEAALAGKAGKMELIKSNAAGDGQLSIGAMMGVKDWGAWDCVVVMEDLSKTTFHENDSLLVNLSLWGEDRKLFSTPNISLAPGSLTLVFFPRHDADGPIRGFLVGGGCASLYYDYKFSQINGLIVLTSRPGGPETRFVSPTMNVYGIR